MSRTLLYIRSGPTQRRKMVQVPRQLESLPELPHENARFPSFVLDDRHVLMRIGSHSPIWRFEPESVPIKLSRHGTFSVEGCHRGGAIIRMVIPRKGWNSNKGEAFIELLPRTEITIRRAGCFRRDVEEDHWDAFLDHYRIVRERFDRRKIIEVAA